MPNSSHMDVHTIYDLTVVHLFKRIFNLESHAINTLQASRYLNPALGVARGKERHLPRLQHFGCVN